MKGKHQSHNIQWRCAVATVRMDGSVYNNSVGVRAETSVRAKKWCMMRERHDPTTLSVGVPSLQLEWLG